MFFFPFYQLIKKKKYLLIKEKKLKKLKINNKLYETKITIKK